VIVRVMVHVTVRVIVRVMVCVIVRVIVTRDSDCCCTKHEATGSAVRDNYVPYAVRTEYFIQLRYHSVFRGPMKYQ